MLLIPRICSGIIQSHIYMQFPFFRRHISQRSHMIERSSTSNTNGANRIPIPASRRQLQLCYLQLCLATPLFLYHMLFFIRHYFWPDDPVNGDKRRGDYRRAYEQVWLYCFVFFFETVAHCFHFFLYLGFSITFRNGFLRRCCRR